MKKAVSLLLTLILTLSLCTPVWADNTGTVKSVSALAVVGTATEEDLAKAKAFLGDTGVFVYYEEAGEMANQIMPRGTNFGQQNYKDVTTEAVKKYNALGDGVKAILETLYVTDGKMPCFFSYRVNILQEIANNPDPGPGPGPGGGEQGGQVDIDKALKDADYRAPVLRSEGNAGDFYITFPQDLKEGTDYEYNYANGVLTVTVLKGSEEHWLAAAKKTNNGSVGYTLHFVKPENAVRIAKFNGNNDQAAYQFINGNMEFNEVGNEQAFGGVMAAVNQSGDVLSVTATPNFNGMRSFVVWAAGAESEEAGQNTPIEKLTIRAEIVIEKENYFHYETINSTVSEVKTSRLISGAELNATYKNTWECAALEPGVLIVRPIDGKTVDETLNTQMNVHLGTVTIAAPSGYTLVLNECKVLNGNNAAISENNNTNGDSKCVVSLIALDGRVSRAQYLLVWKDAAGNIKRERFSVSVEDGAKLSGLGTGNKPISVPVQSDMDTPTGGVNVTYDGGHFYTSFDSNSAQLPNYQELEKGITLKPDASLQGVTHYRVMSVTGNSSALEGEILSSFNILFRTIDSNTVREYNPQKGERDLQMRYVEVAYQDIGGVTVGYTSMLGYRHMAAEWLKKNDDGTYEVLGYTYVCGRNDSFVQTTITNAESSAKESDKPYIIGNEGEKFKCDRYPQRGEGKDKQYFKFTLIDGQGRENGKYVVYVPYAYFDMTTADGAARKARGEHPTIKHYYNHEFREEFEGEYTEYGIKFEVSDFSPFVISTAAQSSSGGGYYYYGGASTPGISAVKTADAAKSATDYTSGIYGLTFRSTAAFSGFKGVQVDGRTIAAANYVAEDNGGIEVYLKAVYLRTLKDGRHTVTILSDAGNVTMNFTIGGVDSPTTFDAGIGAYVGMALASVGGMAWMRRRKR